jgi:hypothetical protein
MLDRLDDGRTHGSTVRPNALQPGSEQCHIDRSAFEWRQPICDLVENPAEQIAQGREGELRFLLGSRRRKNAPSLAVTDANGLCPKRGLPDTSLPLDAQRPGVAGVSIEEQSDLPQLGFPTEDPVLRLRQHPPSPLRRQ